MYFLKSNYLHFQSPYPTSPIPHKNNNMCVRDCVPPGSDLGSSQPHCVIASERSPGVQQIETILNACEYASYETKEIKKKTVSKPGPNFNMNHLTRLQPRKLKQTSSSKYLNYGHESQCDI